MSETAREMDSWKEVEEALLLPMSSETLNKYGQRDDQVVRILTRGVANIFSSSPFVHCPALNMQTFDP